MDRLPTPSDIFDYSHYSGDIDVTLSAEGPILLGCECVELESEPSAFATSCFQRQFLCSLIVPWEVYKEEMMPLSSY